MLYPHLVSIEVPPPPHDRMSSTAGGGGQTSKKRGRDEHDDFGTVRRALQAMETTFITIHDLTYDANILYASTSISDVLDWRSDEVVGKSCWDFFHPDEIPFAKAIHGRGVELDKASVLNYCRIKNKYGEWVGCECVFTVVYNVLIGCTSIYMDGPKAKKRAVEAPVVRQLFSSSPRDPRYHMLQYISSKFASGPRPHLHEPRAALFLNRFTRTLTINFATNGLEKLLGIPARELTNQSFYYCIQENCLGEAIRCLESAKANDSIAYLRFWFRDPRTDTASQHDEIIDDVDGSSSDEDGGVQLNPAIQVVNDEDASPSEDAITTDSSGPPSASGRSNLIPRPQELADDSRHSSGNSTDLGPDSSNAIFDNSSNERPSTPHSVMSLDSPTTRTPPRRNTNRRSADGQQNQARSDRAIELEAVVSCTSDGLVVIMRAARPFVPDSVRVPPQRVTSPFSNGLFASPWATVPIMPDPSRFTSFQPSSTLRTTAIHTSATNVQPVHSAYAGPREPATSSSGPPLVDFMNSIRDVAVFAWALTGINGSLQRYGRGRPLVGSVPGSGLPIWDPDGTLAEKEKANTTSVLRKTEDGYIASTQDPPKAEDDPANDAEKATIEDTGADETAKPIAAVQSSIPDIREKIDATEKTPAVNESEVNGEQHAGQ